MYKLPCQSSRVIIISLEGRFWPIDDNSAVAERQSRADGGPSMAPGRRASMLWGASPAERLLDTDRTALPERINEWVDHWPCPVRRAQSKWIIWYAFTSPPDFFSRELSVPKGLHHISGYTSSFLQNWMMTSQHLFAHGDCCANSNGLSQLAFERNYS